MDIHTAPRTFMADMLAIDAMFPAPLRSDWATQGEMVCAARTAGRNAAFSALICEAAGLRPVSIPEADAHEILTVARAIRAAMDGSDDHQGIPMSAAQAVRMSHARGEGEGAAAMLLGATLEGVRGRFPRA